MGLDDQNEDARPLYAKVRDQLIERIRSGAWKPGQLIPNEFEIAAEFGVSQGTARKAISTLASEQLLLRKQGRGTFVVEHTPAHVQFRFFSLFDADRTQILPECGQTKPLLAKAEPEERDKLELDADARVIRISRVRTRRGKPFIAEAITLPEAMFPGLADRADTPNTLYDLYQKDYGVLVVRTDERITAVAADASATEALGVAAGTPLLKIDRLAVGLDDRRIEWRVSLCHLENAYYFARLK